MAVAGILTAVGTYYLSEPVEVTVKVEGDVLDATHLGSTDGAREFVAGPTKWTVSANGDWETADAALAFAQITAQGTAATACTPIALTVNAMECGGGGNHTMTGNAYITSTEIGTPVDGKISMAVEWQGSGVLVYA